MPEMPAIATKPLEVTGELNPDAERSRPIKQVRASIGVIRLSSGAMLG